MYTTINFKSKKELKQAVADGKKITIFAPSLGSPQINGTEFLEGPHHNHSWYAQVEMKDGFVVKVK